MKKIIMMGLCGAVLSVGAGHAGDPSFTLNGNTLTINFVPSPEHDGTTITALAIANLQGCGAGSGQWVQGNECVDCACGHSCDGSRQTPCGAGTFSGPKQERCAPLSQGNKVVLTNNAACGQAPITFYVKVRYRQIGREDFVTWPEGRGKECTYGTPCTINLQDLPNRDERFAITSFVAD